MFVHVNRDGRPLPYGIVIDVDEPEEIRIQEMAKDLSAGKSSTH